ncbi:cell division protein FtsA [Candidatus Saccharibacteria bacterium]|nr:cell division protein FtsA [Candidatus Saccharibacteria bacterium]
MQEHQDLAVGIDVGTTTVRCAIGVVKPGEQAVSLIGIGESANTGFKKGSVVNISDAAQAIDQAVAHAERMSGVHISGATININGEHITGTASKGTVAISGEEIMEHDLLRAEDAATVLQLPQHHEILSVFPRSYSVDNQGDIKDPLGMSGTRLEVDAHVVTVSAPALKNLEKVLETAQIRANRLTVSSLAAAQATATKEQKEHGVAIVDIGSTTTNLITIEDGDVQQVSVLPIGGNHITNDLAIGLKTDLKVAEAVKRHYKYLAESAKTRPKHIKVVVAQKEHVFLTKDIELVITARLVEIFEAVNKELAKVGLNKKLPGGVTLTGGTAQLPGIEVVAREELELSARTAFPAEGISGLKEKLARPEYAVVAGLMLLDQHKNEETAYGGKWLGGGLKQGADQARSLFKRAVGKLGF